jgi:multidrug efflux pump subunit AcrB
MMRAWQTPELTGVFGGFRAHVPQIDALVDREKAKQHGLDLNDIYLTLQTYLGSFYVNDFNRFGKTYQVIAQADYPDRLESADIGKLKVRNNTGDMVPLSSVVSVEYTNGPDRVMHYNGYPSADLSGAPAPGISSGQAQAIMAQLAAEVLPAGITYEWTELAYQNQIAGNSALYIFPLVVLLVYMVLAAQYESLVLPLAVILIVPMTILSALFGVHLWGGDNNVFTQIALFVLVGLATKNAILIVEFAKSLEEQGWQTVPAAIEACRLRLRPILMTSLSFIMGVSPLAFAVGAGAEIRQALGVAVFWGMLGVTVFGLVLTPVFYVTLRKLFGGRAGNVPSSGAPLSGMLSTEVPTLTS